MSHFIARILLFFCIGLSTTIAHAAQYEVSGMTGKALENIQLRLNELYQKQSILNEPPEALKSQIQKALYPYGYFKPMIQLRLYGKKLRIHISPGPQMRITHLTVNLLGPGANDPEILKALHSLPIAEGQPLDNKLYEDAKAQLRDAAEHQGYLRASFSKAEMLIDRAHYTTTITLDFDTGPRFYFGKIQFDPTYISPELLYRYVPFKRGEPYSTDDILDLESNLSSSGYFKSVIVRPDTQDGQDVPIAVHLEETKRTSYFLSVGYGTDTGPRGRAGINVIPVNRYGHKLNAVAQGSFNENAMLAQYIIPGKNPMTDRYNLSGSVSNLNYNSGYSNSILLSAAHQHITPSFQSVLSLNALSERFSYTGILPKVSTSMAFPRGTLTWRKVSDPLFSPSGYNVTISGYAAAKNLASQINVAQAVIDAKAAVTFDMIRTRILLETIQGVTQTNDIYTVPLSLAMLLGGAENMRGYNFNAIGPGKIMTYGGIEIQKETVDKWYVMGIFDVGDVYNPSVRETKYDAGIGLMWVSPVGPIKVAVAQPFLSGFNRDGHGPKLVVNMGPDI